MGGTLLHADFTEFAIAHVLCCIMNMVEIWLHLYSSGMITTADQLPGSPGGPGGGSPKCPMGLAKQHSHGGTDPKGMKCNKRFH